MWLIQYDIFLIGSPATGREGLNTESADTTGGELVYVKKKGYNEDFDFTR